MLPAPRQVTSSFGGHALLHSDTLEADVAKLSPLAYYFAVKEVGAGDAGAIVHAASTAQLQAICDLDCWDSDTFCPDELETWLASLADHGMARVAEVFMRLDLEVQVLYLAQSLIIFDQQNDPDVDLPGHGTPYEAPDGFFVLFSRHAEDEEQPEIEPLQLVEALYRHDIGEAFRLISAARWELPTETCEAAYQFRQGRLQDMGFTDAADAARLFAPAPAWVGEASTRPPLPPWTPPPFNAEAALPALHVATLAAVPAGGFARALASLHGRDARHTDRLRAEFVALTNMTVVAYGDARGDLAAIVRGADTVRDMVSLALEILSPTQVVPAPTGDVPLGSDGQKTRLGGHGAIVEAPDAFAAASALLPRVPLLHLFQVGFAAIRPLHRAARVLVQDPVVAAWLQVGLPADEDPHACDRAFLRALSQPRPRWAGHDRYRPADTRTWQSLADVATTEARLQDLTRRLL